MRLPSVVLLLVCALALVVRPTGALPSDPAARGLDLFIHAPTSAAPGAEIEVLVEAFGFPTVTHAVPLPAATVEAGWDPEELDGQPPPPTVIEKTDAGGHARVVVRMPPGAPASMTLLLGVRQGTHARTQTVKIARAAPARVELHVADRRVVPGSTISAWLRVVSPSGDPLAGASVKVSLEEGGVARQAQRLTTDRGGMAMARVPIPRIDEPVWQWKLKADADAPGVPAAQVDLFPREENPGTPVVDAAWDAPLQGVAAGDRVGFSVRVLDATRAPVADHPIVYWIGVRGTAPPSTEEEWKKIGTRATTDGAGTVRGTFDAPTLVKRSGSGIVIVARSNLEGHALEDHAEVNVGTVTPEVTVTPETSAIVPGLAQRLAIRVVDGRDRGVAGTFDVTADGLATTVTTNADGDGSVTWDVPAIVGAARNTGPCAGGVAAAVTVRATAPIAALAGARDAFVSCVPVDRDAEGIARVEPTFARPGERVRVTLIRARKGKRAASVVASAADHPQSFALWLEGRDDGSATGEVTVPTDAGAGMWTLSFAGPDGARAANVASTSLFVVPSVLPKLEVKRTGGRATPGGVVEVEGRLTDGHGRPLAGSVSAIVVDAFGGGNANVGGLDTRTRLCAELGHVASCDALLERDPSTAELRRTLVSRRGGAVIAPANDPGAHASKDLEKTFGEVLRSLEGAVFEAALTPNTLLDVGRKQNGRWSFNPELLTLATEAMSEEPLTPGGEKLTLADLSVVDPQVTFDNVARRITRLKLFRVLAAVRAERTSRSLDPDEPVFKDPNALLRRLVRKGALSEDTLLDPWGGTIQFVRANAAPVPFLTVARGWELHAPGPDGVVGSADDVRDPFERVVRSGTPYANAVGEDRLVDARWDMVVSEETVQSWQQVLEEVTGTRLGNGGLGMSGYGSGGGGRGQGIGLGRVGTVGHGAGTGRGSSGISTGDAYWVAPLRTDAEGRVRLSIPLGDVETTWQLALVGVVDGGGPATATLAIPSDLPVSARVAGGARWVEGDAVETEIIVRNRTDRPTRAKVSAHAEGVATGSRDRTVDVPPHGARSVHVRVSAARAGEGVLVVTTQADGLPQDVLRHTWEVVPAGEMRGFTRTSWVDGAKTLAMSLDHGHRLVGTPRVVLGRGYDDAVAAALDSLEPDRQASTLALVDAYEAAVRIERWATTRPTPRHRALVGTAQAAASRALGRHRAFAELDTKTKRSRAGRSDWLLASRMTNRADCPPAGTDDALDVEPAPTPDVLPCWGAYVADATRAIEESGDPERVAQAVLALVERPHRAAITTTLVGKLRQMVALRPGGEITSAGLVDRGARATVYAALLRAQRIGYSPASAEALFAQIAVLRDVTGGYGSSSATLAVVRALLASQLDGHGTTRARVRVPGVLDRRIDVPESGEIAVALPADALSVEIETEGPGLVARFERPALRLWSRPPPPASSPVAVEVIWPAEVRAGSTALLRIMLRHGRDEPLDVDVRVPLPPGATLAAPTGGVTQMQGALLVRRTVGSGGATIEVPVRFALAGKTTAPEASARLTRAPTAPAFAPARAIVVRPR